MKKRLSVALCLSVFITSCFFSPPQPVTNNSDSNNNSSSQSSNNSSPSSSSNSGNSSNSNSSNNDSQNNSSSSNGSNSGNTSNGNSSNNSQSEDNFAPDYTEPEIETKEKEQVKAVVKVLDSNSDQVINKPIEVTVVGPDSNKVEKTEFISDTGFITLFLKPNIKPETDRPLNVKLLLEIDGFIPTNIPILISNNLDKSLDTNYSQEEKLSFNQSSVKMVNLNSLPEGVVNTSTKASVDNNGALLNDLKVDIIEPKTNTKNTISIDKGTVLVDDKGIPLSGELQCDFTYFNPKSQKALEAFPGGLNVTTLKDNKISEGSFISAGLVNFNITDISGRQANKATNPTSPQQAPINVTMQVPSSLPNPTLLKTLNPKDLLPYWSYNKNTGNWSYLGEVQIINEGNINVYIAKFSLYNFNMCNIDYYFNTLANKSCSQKIIFKRNPKDNIKEVYLIDNLKILGNKYLIDRRSIYLGTLKSINSSLIEQSFYILPLIPNFEHDIEFYIFDNNGKIITSKVFTFTPKNPCDPLSVSLELEKSILIDPVGSSSSSSGGGSSLGGGGAISGPVGSGSGV